MLASMEVYHQLEFFFTSVLDVRDTGWKDYIKELHFMKDNNEKDIQKASDIYDRLWQDFRADSQHGALL